MDTAESMGGREVVYLHCQLHERNYVSVTAEIARVGGRYAVQGHSRSPTNRKPVYDFLLVNNTNLHAISFSHRFPLTVH